MKFDDDLIWRAALLWWAEKQTSDPSIKSNIQHADRPTVGCTTPGERALALAVAACLTLEWQNES